jgi:AraC-like DNA-binding protein
VRKGPAGKKKSKLFCKQIQGFSSRNLSFISDSQLIASSYDGIKEITLSDFTDSLDVNTLNSKITECITGYPVYYYRDSVIEIAINGKGGHYAPIHTDSCSFLESPLPYRTELYGFQPIGFHRYLVGGKRGLYISKLSNTTVTAKVVIKEGKDTIQSLSVNRIKRIEDSDTLVICALEGLYLCRWDSSTTYLDLIHKYTEVNVNDAVILPDKSIMIATRHRGMLWLDSAPNFTLRYAFNLTNHFSSMVANNILSDDSGRVWISTNSGIYLIDLSAQRVFDFKDIPELSEQEFNHLSSAENSAGLLAFGGVDGVTFIDPKTMPALDYNEWDTVEIKGFHSYGKGSSKWDFYRQNEKFKVGYNIEAVKPVAQSSLFDSEINIFYKPTGKPYAFWQEARNGSIPKDKLEGHKEMSVIWESSDGSRHYSAFKYEISSEYSPYYVAIGITFILIVALLFFLNSRQYSKAEKTNNIESRSLQEEKVGSKTETLPRASREDLLESYLAQLKERENEVYIIPDKLSSKLLEQVTEIVIRDMSSTDFSVDQVAVEVNLSSRQLHRKLIELTGLTPNKYFVFIKMKKAKEMMIENIDLRVGEVSTAVGYSNASYFSKVFIKIYKVKPTEMMEDIKQIWQSNK